MSDLSIEIANLGKKYRIGGLVHGPTNLRESITQAAKQPVNRFKAVLSGAPPTNAEKTFWALRDISLTIPKGECVGLIGVNGCGKSTLLKTIARIVQPTEGYVKTFGRVGSLIEVGAGFHPELTGRENVYLNGTVFGMSRDEINGKFESIIDFADIWEFVDTPLKRYSSGMRVRLGFAVAIHIDPEI